MSDKPRNQDRTIFRIEKNKDNPFVMMDKRPLENDELSWEAKGILAYLLSRPDNWVVQLQDLLMHATNGSYTVRKAVRELHEAGHMNKRQVRENGRIVQWVWDVYEVPFLFREIQQIEKQLVEKQQVVIRALNNIDIKQEDDDKGKRLKILSELYEKNIGALTPLIADSLKDDSDEYPKAWYVPAFELAVKNNARSLSYIEKIWNSWKQHGFGWKPEFKKRNQKPETTAPIQLSKDELKKLRAKAEKEMVG
jgi:DnaD/phage-associated family protein